MILTDIIWRCAFFDVFGVVLFLMVFAVLDIKLLVDIKYIAQKMANPSHSVVYQSVKVLIDSRYRNDPTPLNVSNFTYSLNRAIGRVSSVYVESAQIPFTYYAVDYNSQNLIIIYSGVPYVATVTRGNYNSGTILAAVKQALDSMLIGGITWTVTFDPSTVKMTISMSGGVGVFSIVTEGDLTSIGPLLGFTVDAGPAAALTSNSVLDLSGPRYLVIKSQLIGENRAYPTAVSVLYSAAVSPDAIIHTVPVNTNPGGVILDLVPEPRNNILGFKTTYQNNIDFRLEDDRGNLLDLNGGQWSMQLTFELR